MRVLLVEDDVTAARGISLILKSAGFTADHTDMGQGALDMVRRYDYELLPVPWAPGLGCFMELEGVHGAATVQP